MLYVFGCSGHTTIQVYLCMISNADQVLTYCIRANTCGQKINTFKNYTNALENSHSLR